MDTRIIYINSRGVKKEWVGDLPLLAKGMCLTLPERAATRITDIKLVLGPIGINEQVVFTGLVTNV